MSPARDSEDRSGMSRASASRVSKSKVRKSNPMSFEVNESSHEEPASSDSDSSHGDDLAIRMKNRSARRRPLNSNQSKAQIAILQDSVRHIGLSVISRPATSSYIPTAYNMFAMLDAMSCNLAENPHLHGICPEFFTPVLYLYYGHVVYFHILRARAYSGTTALTRFERRLLSQYQRVAPAESWPIAAPLVGFIQAMGAHKPEDSYHSSRKKKGLSGLENVPGMLRLPVIPALQKLLRDFGSGAADYTEGMLYPNALPLAGNNQFVGISSSGTDSPSFLAITYNLCWRMPAEIGLDNTFAKTSLKRSRISRWNVPDVPNDATLNSAESFLGFASHQSFDWMRNLFVTARFVNRFFPNSTTLSKIPPMTTLGSLTHVEYRRVPPTALKDTWYYDLAGVTLKFRGFSATEDGLLDTRLGIATATNAEFPGFFPENVTDANPTRVGPFFADDANAKENRERNAIFLSEGYDDQDPAGRYSELITKCFDATGGMGKLA